MRQLIETSTPRLPPLTNDSRHRPLCRMTLAYFCLASLAILPSSVASSTDEDVSALEVMLKPEQVQGFRDWVYEQQIPTGGFRGSDSLAAAAPSAAEPCAADRANVIQTYTALAVLGLLGDDYARLDRTALKRFLGECQNRDGSCVVLLPWAGLQVARSSRTSLVESRSYVGPPFAALASRSSLGAKNRAIRDRHTRRSQSRPCWTSGITSTLTRPWLS